MLATEMDPVLAVSNPNKALVVINGRTTEILTANNTSCELFGLSEVKLIGKKLKDLLDLSEEASQNGKLAKQDLLMESDRLDENGKVVLCSGKIFDAITNLDEVENAQKQQQQQQINKSVIAVSIYMLKLTDESEPKCLCVMEPVQRICGSFAINVKVNKNQIASVIYSIYY
jgi:PAS domain S-box-containing protein